MVDNSQGFIFNLAFYVFHISACFFSLRLDPRPGMLGQKEMFRLIESSRSKGGEITEALNAIKFKSTENWTTMKISVVVSVSCRRDEFVSGNSRHLCSSPQTSSLLTTGFAG